MNQTLQRESAKIYQFPIGGRNSTSVRRGLQRTTKDLSAEVAVAECGSGWYHEVAIRNAEQGAGVQR